MLVILYSKNYVFSDSSITVEILYLFNTYFKNIPSLKEIIINFEVYSKQDSSGDLIKIHDYRWIIKVTKLLKKTWISEDD